MISDRRFSIHFFYIAFKNPSPASLAPWINLQVGVGRVILKIGFCVFLLLPLQSLFAQQIPNKAQTRMLNDLKLIKHAFVVKYAPSHWKKEHLGWDLDLSYEKARNTVLNNPSMTLKEFQCLIKKFFMEVRDYHVSVAFFSTEEASLPFLVQKAEGRYFVVYIGAVDTETFPLNIGDELVMFDGKEINAAIADLKSQEIGNNSPLTDQAMAEMSLTNRSGMRGDVVPRGTIEIGVKKNNHVKRYNLKWDYHPEKIQDSAKNIDILADTSLPFKSKQRRRLFSAAKEKFFNRTMAYPFWEVAFGRKMDKENPFAFGARKSFIPDLGQKIWEGDELVDFDAYIFVVPPGYKMSGKKMGYLRIPNYCGDSEEVLDFKAIIEVMQANTDALIIDQLNNPGGNLFYLYGLASLLTNRPLLAPKHHLAITQQEVYTALTMLSELDCVTDDTTAQEAIGKDIAGYCVDFTFACTLKRFCDSLVEEWNRGNVYTSPMHLFGFEAINPHPEVRYTKPILVLINSLDFSSADFFPAILQDNKRATLFGSQTAGAGGFVLHNTFQNFSGIVGFSLTASFAERCDSKPIENLGVTPDIYYEFSQRDLKEGYCDYVHNVLTALEGVLK